ncbi:MAG: antibiotic biosynthesis monooxygenase [Polyangiaceae bacterium]
MFIINSTWNVLLGQEAAARQALIELEREVHASEPDTWMYLIHAPNTAPGIRAFPPASVGSVTFFEGFKDEHAFKKHVSSGPLQRFIQKHGELFLNMYGTSTPFVVSQGLSTASGFIREAAAEQNLYTVIARWSIQPGHEAEAVRALHHYVSEVLRVEPGTYMYTANQPAQTPELPSFPSSAPNQLVFNSGWKDHDAFVHHTQAAPYKQFLEQHGKLFIQVNGAKTSNQPYMTTAVLKRIAGFFRPEAFFQRP